jgi:hypothetical protein
VSASAKGVAGQDAEKMRRQHFCRQSNNLLRIPTAAQCQLLPSIGANAVLLGSGAA